MAVFFLRANLIISQTSSRALIEAEKLSSCKLLSWQITKLFKMRCFNFVDSSSVLSVPTCASLDTNDCKLMFFKTGRYLPGLVPIKESRGSYNVFIGLSIVSFTYGIFVFFLLIAFRVYDCSLFEGWSRVEIRLIKARRARRFQKNVKNFHKVGTSELLLVETLSNAKWLID